MIRPAGPDHIARGPASGGVIRSRDIHTWEIRTHTLPWWHAKDRYRPCRTTPSADQLWRWAAGMPNTKDERQVTRFLGLDDGT